MAEWFTILMWAVVIVTVVGFVISVRIGKTQTRQESSYDDGVPVATKNRVTRNPIAVVYLLFPVVALIGAALFYYFYLAR